MPRLRRTATMALPISSYIIECFKFLIRVSKYHDFLDQFIQGPIMSGHVLISWSNISNSACCFGDALRCVASADQNMAPHNRPLDFFIGLIGWKRTTNFTCISFFRYLLGLDFKIRVLNWLFTNCKALEFDS